MFFRPKYKEMSTFEFMEYLPNNLTISGRIHAADNVYRIPKDPWYVMKKIKSYKYKYIPDKRDCDDFVRIFRGILSQKGWGNLLTMDCIVEDKETHRGHRLIGFINLITCKIIFGEPQTGQILMDHNYKLIKIEL